MPYKRIIILYLHTRMPLLLQVLPLNRSLFFAKSNVNVLLLLFECLSNFCINGTTEETSNRGFKDSKDHHLPELHK